MTATSGSAALAEEVIARCRKLASFSEDAGSIRRMFLGPALRDCHEEITRWMTPLAMAVSIDALGNLHGIYPATGPRAPRLLLGSHLDTVPNAGAYDGVLGVVLAVALLQALNGRRLPFGIEIVGFSEEEGVRFATPFIGSRGLVGRVDEALLARRDANGISVRQALEQFGLDPHLISQAALKDDILGYLEFHIEQGPVLEKVGKPLGVVQAIAGQTRLELVFLGRSNHAGTTPMDLRYDALAAAAEWIGAVEHLARNVSGLVATVGTIEAQPGATNVIPGRVRLTLDVRHGTDDVRLRAVQELAGLADEIAHRRGLSVEQRKTMEQPAVAMDPFLARQIDQAVRNVGCEPHPMTSGAGHDAMILAEKVPAAMIFLRTPGGISHDPAESVDVGDVTKAIECGVHLLDQLAGSVEFQGRTSRA